MNLHVLSEFEQRLQDARSAASNKNYPAALKLFGNLTQTSKLPNLWEEHGQVAAAAGDYDLADRLWERVLNAQAPTAAQLSRLAKEYGKIGLFAKARVLCARAAGAEPRNLELQLNLASFLARTGGIEEARAAVNGTLALDSYNEPARYLAAHLNRRESKLAAAERQLRDLLAGPPRDPELVMYCHFELAHILDRTERYEEAMTELAEAKRVAATTFDTEESMKKCLDRRERTRRKTQALPPNALATWAKSFPPELRQPPARVAFLGGHPRSGTTLLEKVLDAHPSVAAADETLAFASISQLIDITAPDIPVGGLNFLRQRYLKNMARACPPPGPDGVILDKNPAATAHLPAFLRAFPELRVVIALRDPRDVLVSSYFESLRNVSHFTFERLAEHYCAMMDVWLLVRSWEAVNFMETRYEDIVADLEKEGASVTKFLGLQWDAAQARFHESNRQKPVMSSNYSVVTQPVYQRAVGRWRVYEKHLAPVLGVLRPYCRLFGYAET
jgi:tetratricopeptide (TPR) repeat protein